MTVDLHPCGDRAVLADCPDRGTRRHLASIVRAQPPVGVVEVVEGAFTVLVRVATPSHVPAAVAALRAAGSTARPTPATPPRMPSALDSAPVLVVPVTYDGPDLAALADHLGTTTDGLVARHTGVAWVVDFLGFLPGFAYLLPDGPAPWPDLPRHPTPRTRVPAGSVALAGPWCGLYPSPSPGGWQLLGRTELALWRADDPQPALFAAHRRVRFEARP